VLQAQETRRALVEIGALAELEAPDAGGGATGDSGAPDAPRSARPGGVHDA
jgi:hypothetical protein